MPCEDRLHLFASLFYGYDDQDSSLDLSNFQRYFQSQGLLFFRDGRNQFRNEQLNLIVGARATLDEHSDGRLSYRFTRAHTDYHGASTRALDLIQDSHELEAGIHAVDLEIGRQLREGLRVAAGYRFQLLDDDSQRVQSNASVVRPFDRSTHQHTVMLSVTLTSDLLEP